MARSDNRPTRGERPEWQPVPLGEPNYAMQALTDDEFAESLDAWRQTDDWFSLTSKIWCAMYLNEAERRWRPAK